MTDCDEIISALYIVSTKKTNTIIINISMNSGDKIVRYKIDCYILYTVLLAILLLLIIIIICYHYATHKKKDWCTINMKWWKSEFKNLCIKNRTCYYFDDTIKLEDFDIDNILIDKKSHKKYFDWWHFIWNFNWCQTFHIFRFDKIDGSIRIFDRTRYSILFGSKI